ncbi:MAG: restriction endonuclease subunit S [Ruminococcus sp.]|nr:restriction endonuclease subunit S [Ruminococcus sp.]
MLQKDDIIISARGTVGEMAMIPFPMAFNQSCYGIRGKECIDKSFLYYLLKNNIHKLKAITHGSVFDTITKDTFAEIDINLPDLETQKKTGYLLGLLDDKIELNNRINKNLEEQAQAIYHNFINHNIIRTGFLSELITVKYGKDHKKLNDGIFPVYGSGGIIRYAEKFLYDKESVLIPRKGSLNNIMYVNEPFWVIDTMFFTEMKIENVAKYVFHFLKEKNLSLLNTGSAVPSMTTDILNSMIIKMPTSEQLNNFESTVKPLYEMIKYNSEQIKNLSALRDTLLPKLMNGEIDI